MKKILIVGIGPFGIVLARELSRIKGIKIEIIDQRNHIGGNCFTERNSKTNVMVHVYGPHIFNTNHEDVWKYINQFAEWMPFSNHVKAVTPKGVYSLPINLLTLNQFFGKRFSPNQAKLFVQKLGSKKIKKPKNFEDAVIKSLGHDLYKNFFEGYTKKQWGIDPTALPADIFKRLPLRFNYDDSYYSSIYQAIPKLGYTVFLENILASANVKIHLQTPFEKTMISKYDHIYFSGSLDKFFNYEFGKLSYRTVFFKQHNSHGDILGNAVINYTDANVPYTRRHEHKHFAPWEKNERTTVLTEFSKETSFTDEPFYPIRSKTDLKVLEKYSMAARRISNISFVGRLGYYRYLDMDQIIGTALDLSKKIIQSKLTAVVKPRNK